MLSFYVPTPRNISAAYDINIKMNLTEVPASLLFLCVFVSLISRDFLYTKCYKLYIYLVSFDGNC